MIVASRKYLFVFAALLASLLYACERTEPIGVNGAGSPLRSVINSEVIRLDTTHYKYIGFLDGRYIFEFQGSPYLLKKGDLFYFQNSLNQIYGEVEEAVNEGALLYILLSKVPVNTIFDYLALETDLSNSQDVELSYLNSMAGLNSDTVSFDPIEFLWDFGGGVWGFLKIDSLAVFNESDGIQNYFLGPVWSNGTATHRIDLSFNQDYQLSAYLDFIAKGEFDVQDSLQIRSRLLGPFYADSFPVYYSVDEWLKIDVHTDGNNSLNTHFRINGYSEISAKYQADNAWVISSDYTQGDELFEAVSWDKFNSYQLSLSLNTIFTPVFCGTPGLEFNVNNQWEVTALVDWPNWDYAISNEIDINLLSHQNIFSDIPIAFVNQPGLSRQLLTEQGQLENQAPIADFSITPSSGFTDTNFEFDASKSSDLEDQANALQVRWDFNGDEVWDTNFSFTKKSFHIFSSPGNYNVILEVQDTQGASARLVKNIIVQETSSAPIAYFTVSPENGRTSDIFTFDASGCWDREDDVSQLKVRWDFDGDDIWDTQFSTTKAEYYVFSVGTYHAKLEVKDTQGLIGSTTRIIEVKAANIKPTAFYSVDPEEGTINTTFRFDASGSSDPEDDVSLLEVRWDFENDGQWDTEFRTIKTINHIFEIAETYRVVLQVLDTDGFSNTYSREIVVSNPNTKPKADFTISPSTGDTTTVFTFDASISEDLEDSLEELLFRWDWDNDEVYDTEFTHQPKVQRTFSETGTYIIKVQVKDTGGLLHQKAHLVIVN